MILKKSIVYSYIFLNCITIFGCNKTSMNTHASSPSITISPTNDTSPENTFQANKDTIDNTYVSDDSFIKGVDISSIISLESSGVKFYDYNGDECDINIHIDIQAIISQNHRHNV